MRDSNQLHHSRAPNLRITSLNAATDDRTSSSPITTREIYLDAFIDYAARYSLRDWGYYVMSNH